MGLSVREYEYMSSILQLWFGILSLEARVRLDINNLNKNKSLNLDFVQNKHYIVLGISTWANIALKTSHLGERTDL